MTTTDQIKLIDDMIKEDDSYTIKDFLELRNEIDGITEYTPNEITEFKPSPLYCPTVHYNVKRHTIEIKDSYYLETNHYNKTA